MGQGAEQWLERIRSLPIKHKIRIMNVCGGHERTITMGGLRSVLPANIELIPGPGCPVCICPEEDIFLAIRLAIDEAVTLLAFGDMLRVPVNVARGEVRSLLEARSAGADIRPIASPLEAVQMAGHHPDRTFVFFVAGFETTTAPIAAMIAERLPENLLILLSGRRTWPAVATLLADGRPRFDGLIAPGHVAAVNGPEEWAAVADEHQMPVAIAGFTVDTILAAIYSVVRQHIEGRCFLDNCYPEVAHPEGNPVAKAYLAQTMSIVDANWRGIGIIPESGFELRPQWNGNNARLRFPQAIDTSRKRLGQMPPGCECAQVVLGRLYPDQCPLYQRACTPATPVGPCMVSDEGACRIWWAGGIRQPAQTSTRRDRETC